MSPAAKKERLDRLLVDRGLAATIASARSAIMAGRVVAGDHRADKPGMLLPPDCPIRLKAGPCPYVSRGGLKLDGPLDAFFIPVAGKAVLDVGASTGGFTDCLLQRGAARVYAIDVGYGQLAWKLQEDPRVIRLDRTNITELKPGAIQPPADMAVIDASFTSLTRLIDSVLGLLGPAAELVCLVKPQFESRRGSVEKGGVVRSERAYQECIAGVARFLMGRGLLVRGIIESPLHGAKGNREFFVCCRKPEAFVQPV